MSTQFVEDIKKKDIVVEVVEAIDKKYNEYDDDTNDILAKFIDISDDAKKSDQREKNMTLKEGLKLFPKAACWSLILSTAVVMEGFDLQVVGGLTAFPSFREKYGKYYPKIDQYQIPVFYSNIFGPCGNIAQVIGLLFAGVMTDRYGYKKTIAGFMLLLVALVFIEVFSTNYVTLLIGSLLLSIPFGAFQTLTVSYAADVCPQVLKIYLTTYVNACWVIGQLFGSGVLKGLLANNSLGEWQYKIPFLLQWFWPFPILTALWFCPESPWFLVKKGRSADAKKSLVRLLSKSEDLPDPSILADGIVKQIELTIIKEEANSRQDESSYLACFKKKNFRRTRIACIVWMLQNMTGSALMSLSAYFFEQAGMSPSLSFTFSIIQYALGLLGTLSSWFTAQWFGRYTLLFTGFCVQVIILLIVGGLSFHLNTSVSWGIGSLLVIYTFVYDCTSGPITYCLVTELPSALLRTKTVILSRVMYNIVGLINGILTARMLNPSSWNWGAKTGLFYGAFALFAVIWSYFELPETKGRTSAELDVLFEDGVFARKFKSTEVEVFNVDQLMKDIGEDGVKNIVINDEKKVSDDDEKALYIN